MDWLPPLGLLSLWCGPNSHIVHWVMEWFLPSSLCICQFCLPVSPLDPPFPPPLLPQSSGLPIPTGPFRYSTEDRTYSLPFVSLTFKASWTNGSGWIYFRALTEADRKLPASHLYLPHKFVSLTKHFSVFGAEIWADGSNGIKPCEIDEDTSGYRTVSIWLQSDH